MMGRRPKRRVVCCLGALLPILTTALPATAQPTEPPPGQTIELALPGAVPGHPVDLAAARRWFQWLSANGIGFDRCGFNPAKGTFIVEVDAGSGLDRLTDAGFRVVRSIRAGETDRTAVTDPEYFEPDEIEAMLAQVAADHPSIARMFTIGTTFEGRSIFAIEISNQPGAIEDEPAIQFNGQHHAREVATSHVVMDVVETLTDGYGVDPMITNWVDSYKTVCVPMVNPDGVQYVFDVNSLWRKNRQVYAGGCLGVDLNRNYPYRWGPDRCGSASSCSGETYQGPSIASELETQSLIDLAEEFHFVMATSYHAFGRFIDYPYACSDGSPSGIMPEHDVIDEMMNGAADAIDAVDSVPRYAVFSPAAIGPLSGDDTSWYYAHMGAYSFIIEVGTAFEPGFSSVAGIVDRNRGGWQYMYQRLGQARIDVYATDACTDQPLEAEVTLTDFLFDTDELPRRTFSPFGRWTFVVEADQSYTVRVSEPGYTPQEVTVFIGNEPTPVNVALEPTSPCQPDPIPTMSAWGLVVMTGALLTVGARIIARRRTR